MSLKNWDYLSNQNFQVGSPNTERDIRRAFLVRKVLGPDVRIMLDVNQQWSIAHAQESWAKLKVWF